MNSKKIKQIIKRITPDWLLRLITGLFYGWHGNYSSWQEAKEKTSGYDSEMILKKVTESARKVRDGLTVYERDTVLFDKEEYSFPVLSGLLWVAAQNRNRLSILDFGGALGSTYFQNKIFLDTINELKWCIVEQENVVKTGLNEFSGERLRFFYSIDDCIQASDIDIVLLSSVLQYLEKPYELLGYLSTTKIKYIIVDRTPFISGSDRITIQKVHPAIYKATYPCWFFNKEKFLSYMRESYELVMEFDALDKANIPSEFKGFMFRKK